MRFSLAFDVSAVGSASFEDAITLITKFDLFAFCISMQGKTSMRVLKLWPILQVVAYSSV